MVEMVYVPTKMPSDMVAELDKLVADGKHENRSLAIRDFVKKGLKMGKKQRGNVTDPSPQ